MDFPQGIPRRQRTGPGKLEKELRLFFILYTDWLHADREKPKSGSGAPIEELQQILAPESEVGAFRRMLDRYLLELKRCGAVCEARVSRDGHCGARFEEWGSLKETAVDDAHLNRLVRTTALMRKYLDAEPPVGYGRGSYDRFFYTQAFFDSYEGAVKWYQEYFHMDAPQRRTVQRDTQAVWQVIQKMRTE